MTIDQWWIIKVILGSIAGFMGLCASFFTFWSVLQNNDQSNSIWWFEKKWKIISNNKIIKLPKIVINWIIRLESVFADTKYVFIESVIFRFFTFFIWISVLIIGGIYFYGTVTIVIIFSMILIEVTFQILLPFESSPFVFSEAKSKILFALWNLLLSVGVLFIASRLLLESDSQILILVLILFILLVWGPISSFLFGVKTFLELTKVDDKYLKVIYSSLREFLFAVGISFPVTISMMYLGYVFDPSAWIPRTPQMLISNLFFDGITLLLTLKILGWAIKDNYRFRIPFAIIADFCIAAILAMLSLYFGLIYSENSLTVYEVLCILVGRSPHSEAINFGPLFWVIHSTFIPTFLYLSIILICWFGKVTILPLGLFLRIAKDHKKPLALTAALFGFLLAIFGALTYMAQVALEHANKVTNLP